MSIGTKHPADKMSGGTKRPEGQNIRGQIFRLGHIYQGLARQYFLSRQYFLLGNLLSMKENSANTYVHSLGGRVGGNPFGLF
jgi:hypothetical protein